MKLRVEVNPSRADYINASTIVSTRTHTHTHTHIHIFTCAHARTYLHMNTHAHTRKPTTLKYNPTEALLATFDL